MRISAVSGTKQVFTAALIASSSESMTGGMHMGFVSVAVEVGAALGQLEAGQKETLPEREIVRYA